MATPVAALIVRVAADLAELKTGVAEVNTTLGGVTSAAKQMAGVLAAAFSFRDLSAGVARLVDAGGQISDLAQQMGIGAEAVQKLKFAAEQSGSSIEAVANGIRRMASDLNDPSTGTTAGLADLNLNLDALRQMTPDQAFLTIADAIRQVPDPMKQSALAVDLFGRNGMQLLPAIKTGIREIGDAAPVMSDATIAALDESGDKWEEAQAKINALKAKALTPLLDLFLTMPDTLQVAAGGIAAFMPSLEGIGLAIMAAGGPVAAFAGMKTGALALAGYLGTGFAVASAGLITFFTVTIPAAFSTILPFLGPIGLIAAGVAAVVLIWKNWDKIGPIVQAVYTAVKTWLVDKFQAIVDSVKGKIDAVTGFFGNMYDKVVGNSYVPDMIAAIGAEFGRLDSVMVAPTAAAAGQVDSTFVGLSGSVQSTVSNLLGTVQGWFGNFLSQNVPAFGGALANALSSIADSVLGSFTDKISSGIASSIGGRVASGAGSRVTSGVVSGLLGGGSGAAMGAAGIAATVGTAAATAGVSLAVMGAVWAAKKWLGPSEESKHVNEPRDRFFEQFGGFEGLAATLGASGVSGTDAEKLIGNLYGADDKQSFNNAQEDILKHTGGQKFKTGTPGLGFMDFGSGTSAILHGREAVVPESRAADFAARYGGGADMSGVESRLDRLVRKMDLMPMQMRDVMLLGSVTR